MSKTTWKPGTMLYPVPAVLVTSHHGKKDNVLTVSWAGTICTDPPMLSISLRPERESYTMIRGSGEFAVNLPGEDLAYAVDFCGVKSGRDVDKFAELDLHRERGRIVKAPLIVECPICIECKVKNIIELGSHHLFISEVVSVSVEESLIDRKGKFHIENARLLCYNHGQYYSLSKPLGSFGFSVRRKKKAAGRRQGGSGRLPRRGPGR